MAGELVKIGYANSVDGKTVADTTIYTYDEYENYIPILATFVCTSITGTPAVPTVSIGVTGAAYADIMAATALTGLTASSLFFNVWLADSTAKALPTAGAGTAIKMRVSAAATAATTYAFNVNLFGIRGTY